MVDEVVEWWNILMEIIVEIDEVLIEQFFEIGEFSVDEFKKGICEGVFKYGLVLMFCGFVFKNKGVQLVFDVVIDYLFVFVDVFFIQGVFFDGSEVVCLFDDSVFFSVFVFKVMVDFYGKFIFVWMYFGIFEKGSYVFNFIKGEKECIFCLVVFKVDD